MNFYTSSTFRKCLEDLLKKRKDGYSSMTESNDCKLHQVDITNMMEEISTDGSLTSIR